MVTRTANDRDDTITIIRSELRRRSGRTWSVTGGKGTAWGWITVASPPARRVSGRMTDADTAELAALLGLEPHKADGGVSVPDSQAHRVEYVDRARGLDTATAAAYWD